MCALFRQTLRLGVLGYTISRAAYRDQVGLRAQISLFELLQQVGRYGLCFIAPNGAVFGFGFRSLAYCRQACGFDFGLGTRLGRELGGNIGCCAGLRLLDDGALGLGALVRQPGGFLFRSRARFCGAFEGFFSQFFFAGGADRVEFALIALARRFEGFFFLCGGSFQFCNRIGFFGRCGRKALLGHGHGGEIQVDQVAELIGVGIAYRAHVRQHLLEGSHDLRIELRAGGAFDEAGGAIHGERFLVKPRDSQGFEGIHQCHHAPRPGNFFALEALGVAVAVPTLMVGEGERARQRQQRIIVLPDDFCADLGVPFHLLPFGGAQSAVFVQYGCGHA